MSYAQAHWVGSKPIHRVMQLKLHKLTINIGYSLRMCTCLVDSTNPGRSNEMYLGLRQTDPEAEMSNRFIASDPTHCACAHDGVDSTNPGQSNHVGLFSSGGSRKPKCRIGLFRSWTVGPDRRGSRN